MFSIGDDELDVDLDDEEFLLAACGIPPSTSSTNNAQVPSLSSNDTTFDNNSSSSTTNPRIPLNSLTNSCSSFDNRRTVPSCRSDGPPQQQPGFSNGNSIGNNILQVFNSRTNNNGQKNKSLDQVAGPPMKKIALHSSGNSRNTSYGCNNASSTSNKHVKNFNDNINGRSSPSLSNLNKNNFNSSNSLNQLHSPGSFSNRISKNNRILASPVPQSPTMFQTPNRTNHNWLHNLKTRESSIGGNPDVVDVTPSRKKSARKFPGPAGLLPKLNSGQSLDEMSVKHSPVQMPSRVSPKNVQRPMSSQSQISADDEEFTRDPWIGMYKEYTQNVPALMRYTVLQVISEAAGQRLKYGKVPSLCVLVKTSSPTETDTSILLKDPTGEIHGTLHKKVLEEYPSQLGPGAGIILKQVSVFSPSSRKHYLNITPGNIIHIYPPDPSHVSCSQPLASQGTQVAKPNSQQRVLVEEPEIVLDDTPCRFNPDQEPSHQEQEELENFSDLLEGLDHEDDILDEDLLAMY